MFRNRAITVKMDKITKDKTPETPCDPQAFEKKAEVILHKLQRFGATMFVGVCVFVILDTRRQVAVAKASNPHN